MERKGLFDLPGSVALFLGIIAPATRGLFGIIASFFQNSPLGWLFLLVLGVSSTVLSVKSMLPNIASKTSPPVRA